MKRVEEHGVFAAAVGNTLRSERLKRIAVHSGKGAGAYADCEEYLIDGTAPEGGRSPCSLRIPPTLLQHWQTQGIHFRLCLYLRGGVLMGGHILKRKAGPNGYAMAPTRQELRLTARLLRFLLQRAPGLQK